MSPSNICFSGNTGNIKANINLKDIYLDMISHTDDFGSVKPKFKVCHKITKDHPGIESHVFFFVTNGLKEDAFKTFDFKDHHFCFHKSKIEDIQAHHPTIKQYLYKPYSYINFKNKDTYFNKKKSEIDEYFKLKLFIYTGCLCSEQFDKLSEKLDSGNFDTSTIGQVNSSFLRSLGLQFKGKNELEDLSLSEEFDFLKKYIS